MQTLDTWDTGGTQRKRVMSEEGIDIETVYQKYPGWNCIPPPTDGGADGGMGIP